jgi:hypothetical protein
VHILFFERFAIRLSPQKKEQFFDDRLERNVLGRDQGKTSGDIKAKLCAKDRNRSCLGSIRAMVTLL